VLRWWEQSDCVRCQAGRRVAHKVHSLWDRSNSPGCGLMDNPPVVHATVRNAASTGCYRTMALRIVSILRNTAIRAAFGSDPAIEQALVIGAQRRVTAHRTERGHVQHLTNTRTAAGNMSSTVPLATLSAWRGFRRIKF